jgi:hypothetical protein
MKFSLKHLILFVTVAAMFCGVTGFAYNRWRIAEQIALKERLKAEQWHQLASQYMRTADDASSQFQPSKKYWILHWNIESGGNDPETIAKQLVGFGHYDIIGLSDVGKPDVYEQAMNPNRTNLYRYGFVRGTTGDCDSLLLIYDKTRFDLVESADIQEAGGVVLQNGSHCAPLYVRLKDRSDGQELIVIQNHLAREDAEFRTQQAGALREWARGKSIPIIAIGDYNFDYNFRTQKGNAGFDEFIRDGVWKWIEPIKMIDTNWSDDGNGNDRYPDSMLDFNFVAGAAKHWNATCRVIVREGDFPDDEKTSDHRPVALRLMRSN